MGLVETLSKKETKVRTPDVESQEKDQPNNPVELVNTEKVKGFVARMRDRIDKSPVVKKYQDKIHKKLNKLLRNRNSEVQKLQVDTEVSLAQLTSNIKNEIAEFDKSTGIDEAHKLIAKKDEVKKVFNLETYRKKGSYWLGINSKLKFYVGIDEDGVKKLQDLFGLQPDGKIGPATINKFSEVFDLGVESVKYGEETRYVDEADSEETKTAEVLSGLVSGVRDSVGNFQQGLEMRREWGRLGVPLEAREALIKVYGDPNKALDQVKTVSKYIPNDLDMVLGLVSKLKTISNERDIARICDYFLKFKAEGVTFSETVAWFRKTRDVNSAIAFHNAIQASPLANSGIYSVDWVEINSNPENLIRWVSTLKQRGFNVFDSYIFLSDNVKGEGILDPRLQFDSELDMFDIVYENNIRNALYELKVPEEILDDMEYRKPLTDLYNLKMNHGLDLVKSIKHPADVGNLMKINYFYLRNLGTPEGKVQNAFLHYLVSGSQLIDAESVDKFFGDEAMLVCFEVYNKMGDKKDVDKAIKIGRNLYMRGVGPGNLTLDQIKFAENLSELSLGNLGEIPVYEGRNIVFVSQRQEWKGGVYDGELRFGHEKMVEGLKESAGEDGNVEHFMAEENPSKEDLVEMKKKILSQVENTPPPFTFYFDGHGFEKALILYDDEVGGLEPQDYISVSEFAGAVKKRNEKFGSRSGDLNKDIYIIGSCMNHSFFRNVMSKVSDDANFKKNTVFIGASEFGQSSFSDPRWALSDNRKVMKVGEKGVTLGAIAAAEKEYSGSDISIYSPGEDGIPVQIAKVERVGMSSRS